MVVTAALVFPVFAARVADLLLFIDWRTGYVNSGSIYFRAIAALVIVSIGFFAGYERLRMLKVYAPDSEYESTNSSMERSSFPAGISFFLTGFAIVAASVGILYNLVLSGEIMNVFKSADELLMMGYSKLYYILFIFSSALGVFVAFWFMLVGSWHFRGEGHFAGGRFISIFVAVWYYTRVFKDFVRHPVNPSNINSLALLFSVLSLAIFFTKFTKVVAVDFPLADDPSLFRYGVIAFLWVVGVGAPTALVLIDQREFNQLFMLAADFFAAFSALTAVFARLPARQRT